MKTTTASTSPAPSAATPGPGEPAYGIGVAAVLVLLRGYKLIVSPYFSGSCRFLPSCADYAQEALVRRGLIVGGWLAIKRLARCHPLCAGGHDPVPAASQGH